ncbi:MAG: sulfatase-like hydrolase/transferase [Proteobacteria bacterium]|nr:sulfatase-like hydrolase/transferase [Pseudomonadota bacterium]MBU1715628.1 sulfatase-like hydrolase/transferase [Pseudomonadota bacterium]
MKFTSFKKLSIRMVGAFLCSVFLVIMQPYELHAEPKGEIAEIGRDTNVILITINVLRDDHLSCYGYERQTTPAIDELAKSSYQFRNAFAQAGYTFPSMISILTSIYPQSHKVYFSFKDKLSPRVKTLAELFKIYDYQTAWFAVLDEPHLALDAGFGRGFDSTHYLDLQLNGKEEIPKWISEHKKKPFFVAMNIRHTHGPYFPLPPYRDAFKTGKKGTIIANFRELREKVYEIVINTMNQSGSIASELFTPATIKDNPEVFDGTYDEMKFGKLEELTIPDQRIKLGHLMMKTYNESIDKSDPENLAYFISLYDACILGIDQEIVKSIVATLKKEKIFDKTMVIVTGDHGESHGEHGIIGHGMEYYDQQVHVPLIIKMPRGSEHKEVKDMVQSIDIMPTILDVVGMEKPFNLHGKSFLPLITGTGDVVDRTYVYGENNDFAYLRSVEWKLVVVRKDLTKKIGEKDLLFNLNSDPDELKNIKNEAPEVYQELRQKLKKHLDSLPDYTDQEYQFAPNIDPATQNRIRKTGYW